MMLGALSGCHDGREPSGEEMNAQRHFEVANDPPITAETYFGAGWVSEVQGDLRNAANQYVAALKLDPKHVRALYHLSLVYAKTKEYTQAAEMWQKYAQVTGYTAEAYNNLGYLWEMAGDAGRAEAAYKQGVAKDPHYERCQVSYGLMLARQGRPVEAMSRFETVLTPAEAHYNLGSVYEEQGQKDRARREYQEAIKLDPKLEAAQSRIAALDGVK